MELRIKCCTKAQWLCHSPSTTTGIKQLCCLLFTEQHLVSLPCTRISCLSQQLCDNSRGCDIDMHFFRAGREATFGIQRRGEHLNSMCAFRRCTAFKASSPNTLQPCYSTIMKVSQHVCRVAHACVT